MRKSALITVIILVSACGRSETVPGHTFEVVMEGGIPVGITSAVPKYDQPLFTYEEVTRLQQDESRPETLLFRAFRYLRGDDGCYYIVDTGNDRIAVFDSAGEYLRSIGRQGEGPGEFRSMTLLDAHGGNVLVYDRSLRRLQVFDTGGRFLRSYTSPVYYSINALYPVADEQLLLLRRMNEEQPNEDQIQSHHALVTTADGDTLARISTPGYVNYRVVTIQNPPTMFAVNYPLSPSAGIDFHPERGLFSYHTGYPEMTWYDLEGNPVRKIRVTVDPEPVTGEERSAIMSRLNRLIEEADNERSKRMARATRDNTRIPEFKPYWMDVMVDGNGFIWLEKVGDRVLPFEERGPVVRMVLSPEGEYLGDTSFPINHGTLSRGHFLTSLTDNETGGDIFVIYKLVPAIEGFDYPSLLLP